MPIKCPKCGLKSTVDSNFCEKCGANMQQQDTFTTKGMKEKGKMKKSKVSKVLNREAPSFNWFAFVVIVDILMIFAIFLKDGRIEYIIGFLISILVFIYIYYKCVEKKFLPKSPYDESILIAFASLGYLLYIAAFTYMFFVFSDPDFKDISYIIVIVFIALHVVFILGFIECLYIKKKEAIKRKQALEKKKREKEREEVKKRKEAEKKRLEEMKLKEKKKIADPFLKQINEKKAFPLIISFIEKNPKDTPSKELDKLLELLKRKYQITIENELLQYIIDSEKESVLKQKELDRYETELLKKDKGAVALDNKQINELKMLLKDNRSMAEIKDKVRKWKDEGYIVDELEKMIEGAKE